MEVLEMAARGRPRKWWPRRINLERQQRGKNNFLSLAKKFQGHVASRRFEDDYLQFCNMNFIDPSADSAVTTFICDLLADDDYVTIPVEEPLERKGLKLSSIVEYLKQLAK
jgi:hypothetical protein